MELWMIKCDTGEVRRGEPQWGKSSPAAFQGAGGSWKALPLTGTTVFATAWFREHSVFYSCHLPKYILIDFNLHNVSSGYLEHLQSQDVE